MKLRIGYLSTIYHTALLIQSNRMLEKKGLNVTWKLYGGGPGIVEALEKGELDIGYVGLPPAMIGMAKEAPIKCVAGGHVEGTILSMAKKSSEKKIKDVIEFLDGKRIGSPPKGSIHDIIIRNLLEKQGADAAVVNYPWADFIPLALEKGEVHAAVGTPALGVFLKRYMEIDMPLPPSMIWPNNPSYGIISREEFLSKKQLRIFLEAHKRSCKLIISSPLQVAEKLAKLNEFVDPDFALEVIKLSPRYCASLPDEYIQSTMDFVPVMRNLGYLSKNLNEKDIFYTELIKEIHPEEDHLKTPLNI